MAPQSCSRLSFVNLDQDFDIIWCLWKSKMAVFQRIWDPIMICTRPVYQPSSSTLRMQARLSFLYILSDSDGISCLPQIMILAMMMMMMMMMMIVVVMRVMVMVVMMLVMMAGGSDLMLEMMMLLMMVVIMVVIVMVIVGFAPTNYEHIRCWLYLQKPKS